MRKPGTAPRTNTPRRTPQLAIAVGCAVVSCVAVGYSWDGKARALSDGMARAAALNPELAPEVRRTAFSEVFLRTEQNLAVLREGLAAGGQISEDAIVWLARLREDIARLEKENHR